MKELKLDRKTRYTRTALRDSLVELMKQKPVTSITITELCENADINRTTFYAHYKDQYDLLRQIEEETITYIEDTLNKYDNKKDRREILQMLEEILQYIANNSNSIQVLLSENGDVDFQKKLFRRLTFQETMSKYFGESSEDKEITEYYSVFEVNGSIGFIQHWLKNDMKIPPPEVAKLLMNLTNLTNLTYKKRK
jgi:AcrR family transcriptional regulator